MKQLKNVLNSNVFKDALKTSQSIQILDSGYGTDPGFNSVE